jgi:hypothetical protein
MEAGANAKVFLGQASSSPALTQILAKALCDSHGRLRW